MLQAITATTTGGIGEFANILIGGSYVMILCYSYKRSGDLKGVLIGFVLGTISMTIIGSLVNYFVMLPLYGQLMGLDAIIGLGSAINPQVHDLFTFVIWMIAPFNVLKAVIISLVTLPLYKNGKYNKEIIRQENIKLNVLNSHNLFITSVLYCD